MQKPHSRTILNTIAFIPLLYYICVCEINCSLTKRDVTPSASTTAATDAVVAPTPQPTGVDNAVAANRSTNATVDRIAHENSTVEMNVDYRHTIQAHTIRFPIETIVLIVMFSICTFVYISK